MKRVRVSSACACQFVIEGEPPHNIRYAPLTFDDGCRQRQWSQPFQGEQFSLIWFTPPGDDSETAGKPYGATLDPKYMSGEVRFSIPGYDPKT